MVEYFVVQNGNEAFVVKSIGDDVYRILASCKNNNDAEEIVNALNPVPEVRTTWSELERVAQERGR